ncbi:hypothetical protein KIW84_075079 [Lathyrus oleraceus]|uniref:Uncharacterized protein n=1 Tax=Pisum sativum TaxID=3888 RepID=A0A9D4ZYY8_PEA|nr:hypothetical protein KIW84_075079 [Pisum sativum]
MNPRGWSCDIHSTSEVEIREEWQACHLGGEKALLKKVGAPMSSFKDAQKIIEDGNSDQWGRMVEVAENKNRTGLGFQQGMSVVKVEDMHPSFHSGGFSHGNEQHSTAVIEGDEEEDCTNFVTHGKACNWIAVDIPVIVHRLNNVKEVKIGSRLCLEVKKGSIDLLREYSDVFAWSYQDMPSLDSEIVEHRLTLKPGCPPVKQKLRRTHPDMAMKIKEEVQKQIGVGFLVTDEYPQWVANIVPIPKKDGKVRMYVDYRDLNKASPKDDFPYHTLISW